MSPSREKTPESKLARLGLPATFHLGDGAGDLQCPTTELNRRSEAHKAAIKSSLLVDSQISGAFRKSSRGGATPRGRTLLPEA